ncbi:partial DNA translocase FtsK, partial [Methylacidimicrobium cyclopophantes]
RLDRAPVVLSPEPGYGKSHLIGRLFQKLHGRAIRVYLRPFEAIDRCWERILDRIVRELVRLDPLNSIHRSDRNHTQLERLAALTIGHLTADLFDRGLIADSELPVRWQAHADDLRSLLRTNPLSLWEGPNAASWIEWIEQPKSFLCLQQGLWDREITFTSVWNPHSWLKLLLAYLSHQDDPDRRRLCVEWMRATSLDPEEASFLGVPRDDIPSGENSPEAANELAKGRIVDFCQLARFARPFLFCFDQTEAFAHDPVRAERFGYVVAELLDQAPNQMLVITANQEPWEKRILPKFEAAYRDRLLYPDFALQLLGLDASQARILLESRLRRTGIDNERAERFLANPWISRFFASTKTRGVRVLLQEAERQWGEQRSVTLASCYEQLLEQMGKDPPAFDADALQWLLREGAHALPGWELDEPYLGRKKHLLLRWKKNGAAIGFGWEAGSNWKRWVSIAREAQEEAKRQEGCQRSVFFRSWNQSLVPNPKWKVAEEIGRSCQGPMRIEGFDETRWKPLAALYELHAKVLEGDLDFPREETLAFVRERLRPWAEELSKGIGEKPPDKPPPPIPVTVTELVKRCLSKEPSPPFPQVELGTAFHKIVEEFLRRLLREDRRPRTPDEYWAVLQEIAQNEMAERKSGGTTEKAQFLESALRAFHGNLRSIAASGKISDWKELFEGTEIPLSAAFANAKGRSVLVAGRLDTLRRHPKEGRQIVDYKLSQPSDSPKDLLQLAIYAELLRRSRNDPLPAGILEYYHPSLTTRTLSESALRTIFAERVGPVLDELEQEGPPPAEPPPFEEATARKLEKFFSAHGYKVRCDGPVKAPQLLRFLLSCPPGVRVEQLIKLSPTLRVYLGLDFEPRIHPVARSVAVDLPNPDPFPIPWHQLYQEMPSSLELPLLLGKTVEGRVLAIDLADPNGPHVLVAGTSGSGKSMLLKCFLATLCRTLAPERLEVVLIDPKMLTFADWKEIPQLRGRGLITAQDQALQSLQETAEEMDRRFGVLADEGLERLQQRLAAGKTDIPYRVIFFDEFADWLLGSRMVKQQFEQIVARIAQKGRAAGIHLILATQRPERKVVDGLIRANLPIHICLRVSSRHDSSIVLGESGAETLFGKGDLLCNLGPGGALVRAQAPFLDSSPSG